MEDLEKRLEEIECRIFMLEMKDRWDKDDYELEKKLTKEKKKIEEEINARK